MQSPRVTISTIHSIKGGEADHVALHSEINKIQYDSLMKGDDDEHRVFYVGITRAKKTLHIIESEKQWAYPI
jgi:superfamily I DNA/RNA helicase